MLLYLMTRSRHHNTRVNYNEAHIGIVGYNCFAVQTIPAGLRKVFLTMDTMAVIMQALAL
jgi:hypothetical protein